MTIHDFYFLTFLYKFFVLFDLFFVDYNTNRL